MRSVLLGALDAHREAALLMSRPPCPRKAAAAVLRAMCCYGKGHRLHSSWGLWRCCGAAGE